MTAPAYAEQYCEAYAQLGIRLKPAHGVPVEELTVDGQLIPLALREYYRVAGREERLNQVHDRLLLPDDWFMDGGRLCFMEENQGAVSWGVKLDGGDDPMVEQGANAGEKPLDWYSELTPCSTFLLTMLYWHASFGVGLKYTGMAVVSDDFQAVLDRELQFTGEVQELRTYTSRDFIGTAFSLVKMGEELHLYAGFSTRHSMDTLARQLNVQWEEL